MKKQPNLILFLITALVLLITTQCKKSSSLKEEKNNNQLQDKNLSFIEDVLKNRGAKFQVHFQEGETPFKIKIPKETGSSKILCIPNYSFNITNYEFSFTGNCSGGWQDYEAKIYFSIVDNGSYPVTNPSSLTFSLAGVDANSNWISGLDPISVTYLGSSGNVYNYETDIIDFSSLSIDYCDVVSLYMELFVPFTCNNISAAAEVTSQMYFSSFNRCNTISPVFVDPSPIAGINYFGWILACQPCNFLGTDEFEFQYRALGTSTWTTLSAQNYYTGPFFLSLGTGTFEWRHRNKMTSGSTCYGPWSEIETFQN